MKKNLSLLMMFLLLSAPPFAQAGAAGNGLGDAFEGTQPPASTGGLGDQFEQDGPTAVPTLQPTPKPGPDVAPETTVAPTAEPAPALFDEGVRDITCAPTGNQVDFAQVSGWSVRKGYLQEEELYCIIGQAPDGTTQALSEVLPYYIVPAGDAFLYYGADVQGEMNWLTQRPGEAPEHLGLGVSDEVMCVDEEYIWYYTFVGEEFSLRRLSREDDKIKIFGRVEGRPLTLQEDGGILLFHHAGNRVESWQDGKITTLYAPEDPILSVASIGKNIWVEHAQEFGPLEDGALPWRLPGTIEQMAGTTDQFVFLLSFPGSEAYDVMLFNEQYRAYVRVGQVPASEDAFVELQPNQCLTVWSPVESIEFEVPPAEEWIPYGSYGAESAWETVEEEESGGARQEVRL